MSLIFENTQNIISILTCLVIISGLLGGRKISAALKELKSLQPAVDDLVNRLDAASDEAKENIETLHSATKTGGRKLSDAVNSAKIASENIVDATNSATQTFKSLTEREDSCLQTMRDIRGTIKTAEEARETLALAIEEAERARKAEIPSMTDEKESSLATPPLMDEQEHPSHEDQQIVAGVSSETAHLTANEKKPDVPSEKDADITPHMEPAKQSSPQDPDLLISETSEESAGSPLSEVAAEQRSDHGQPVTGRNDAGDQHKGTEASEILPQENVVKTHFSDVLPSDEVPSALSKPRPYLKAIQPSFEGTEAE